MTVPTMLSAADPQMETPAHPGQQVRPDGKPAELGPAEVRSRLCRIRSEVSALAPVRDTPLGEKLLHDLDEVIESAGQVDPGPVGAAMEYESRPVAALPSGPDYPATTHR